MFGFCSLIFWNPLGCNSKGLVVILLAGGGVCLIARSCPTLCNPMDCGLSGSSVHPGKNTQVGFHAFLQGIFSTQGSNPGLPHCKQILYCLSHQEALYQVDDASFSRHQSPRGLLSSQITGLTRRGFDSLDLSGVTNSHVLYISW